MLRAFVASAAKVLPRTSLQSARSAVLTRAVPVRAFSDADEAEFEETRSGGQVKWFDAARGYGFVTRETEDGQVQDIFVHFSSILGDGYRVLAEGQRVSFTVGRSAKGVFASDVQRES